MASKKNKKDLQEETTELTEQEVIPKDDTPKDNTPEAENEEVVQLKTELDNFKDKHLRLQAEFDNFRKRTLKEKMELLKSGGESVLQSLLPIVDDLERALDAFKDVPDDNSLKQGVILICNKFYDFLKQNGIQEIEAAGKDFDTDLHEAITKIPAPDENMKGKVVDVIQKGYLLNDKVIRFSKVVIGE